MAEVYICFALQGKGEEIGKEAGKVYHVCCKVVPMDWSSAVSLMQEMADALGRAGGLGEDLKVSRTKPLPDFMVRILRDAEKLQRSWFHVYLDNFCCGEKFNFLLKNEKEARGLHAAMEKSWADHGVLSSEKKKVSEASDIQELGALVSGSQKFIGVTAERLVKLIQTTLFVISRPKLRVKWVQVVSGRWVHVLQFRRPGMVCLDKIWGFASQKKRGRKVEEQVRQELMKCCMLSPLFQTCLDARVSTFTTASDASQCGGAVGVAYKLSEEGEDFTRADMKDHNPPRVVPVLAGRRLRLSSI